MLFACEGTDNQSSGVIVGTNTPDSTTTEAATSTAVPTETTVSVTETPAATETPEVTNTPIPTTLPTPSDTTDLPDPADVFSGMEQFSFAGTETLENPDDILSDFLSIDIDDYVLSPILYRYYYTEGAPPPDLYQDICPGANFTSWYVFEAEPAIPVSVGMTVEVYSESSEYLSWFSPIYMDEYRDRAGNPTFSPPVYVAMCLDPQNRHSHSIFVDNESLNLEAIVKCQIVVNDNGQQIPSSGLGPEYAEVSGTVTQTCFYND